MGIELYEHNQTAYDAAVSMLAQTGKAAVIHPTGTGKSFIGFKLCEDNPDAVICWLSPSEYIFTTQLENLAATGADVPENIVFLTYAKLMLMSKGEIESLQPDYIVLDEFHRCGAQMWGKGVQNLLDLYPAVPVLGLSATNIRYLDNQRDMADELFDGNIASQMTLGEAIVRGILNPPKYILSMYSFKRDLERYQTRVRHAQTKAVRVAGEKYLEALRRALDKADGLEVIFDKHMSERTGKYIVFCSNAEHMRSMMQNLQWFSKVDASPRVYSVYSEDPSASRSFQAFKEDAKADHLRLLYAIDALNEGVHVDDIDGVILLRPTVSPIIFKQQIGRALSVGSKKKSVVFDIVMNASSLYSIGAIKEEMQAAITYYHYLGENALVVNDSFDVIDEVEDMKQLFDKLEETFSASWDIMFAEAEKYHRDHGDVRVPTQYKTAEGLDLGRWLQTQKAIYNGKTEGKLTEEQVSRLNSLEIEWESCFDLAWERCFSEAEKYYIERGDLNVPARYRTATGISLGHWLSHMRGAKADQRTRILTPERIARLEGIGMCWDPFSYQWEENYLEAARYYKEHGDLKVPKGYVSANGLKLHFWISRLRRLKRGAVDGGLTAEQIDRLERIGMVWEPFDETWSNGFDEARRYKRAHGDLRVPAKYVSGSGFPLGSWICKMRTAKKNGTLAMERAELLDELGMCWDALQEQWESNFNEAADYYRTNGDLMIPYAYISPKNVRLGNWISQMRKRYKGSAANYRLTAEQISRLERIGMVWDVDAEGWLAGFNEARAFSEKNGSLKVPATYVTESGFKLGIWIGEKRKQYKAGLLDADKVLALEQLGMLWDVHGERWSVMYAAAEKYFSEHGSLNVPSDYVTSDGSMLGAWIVRLRAKKSRLSDQRINALNKIGMQWKSGWDHAWNAGYEHARRYYAENGHLNVPAKYRADDGFNTGSWLSERRKDYKSGKLSPEKIRLLESIGICWDVNSERWRQLYQEATEYYSKYGNLEITQSYCQTNGSALKNWLHRQRMTQESMSEERRQKLNRIGMRWQSQDDKRWSSMYELARAYYAENGDLRIPAKYVHASGEKLGQWISVQRRDYKKDALPKEKIAELNVIGMIWGFNSDSLHGNTEQSTLISRRKPQNAELVSM